MSAPKLTEAQRRCKTVYRQCTCGETAHDAMPIDGRFTWAHKCRNCGREIARWTREPFTDAGRAALRGES